MPKNEAARDWQGEYRALMRSRGFSHQRIGKGQNRHHPRLGFRSGATITVQTAPIPCQVANISVGGISFYADQRLPAGRAIAITFQNGFSLALQPDSSHVEEIPPVLMVTSHKFLIGAHFLNEEDGYRIMSEVLRNQGDAVFLLAL